MAFSDKFKFDERIERIKELIKWFNSVKFNDKSFIIFLANGESFTYRCYKDHIAHLLGIKTDELATTGLFNSKLSSEILEEMIDSQFRIGDKIANDKLKLSTIFSNYVNEKMAFFKSNVSVDTDNIMFVCKYDRNKVMYEGHNPKNCDYIMFKELDDGTILELDLLKQGKYVFPISSRVYNNHNEASSTYEKVLKNQEVTIISSMLINDQLWEDQRKMLISEQDKISRLQLLKNFRDKYNCIINVMGDCEYYYRRNVTNRSRGKSDNTVIENIVECVLANKIIDEKSLNIPFSELSGRQKQRKAQEQMPYH